jgi:hypothetical protein
MNPLDERTNFFLPSISLIATHSSEQAQLEESAQSGADHNNKRQAQLEAKKSLKSFNYVDLDFKVAPLSRELNAEVTRKSIRFRFDLGCSVPHMKVQIIREGSKKKI